ncbi:MAG TPA: MBL fold metallo-hydrolase [Edaphocola sp.]|nr:MBL fold metallo-hydrolase [Edaphocola sp.]
MIVEQLYTNCLSEAAYFIASEGEAAIIDPIRDIGPYIALAKQHHAEIKYIFETHFHADFLSGHLELAAKTGAKIIYGPETKAHFDFYKAGDGEIFPLGKITLQALHTPGHTLESTCYLLADEQRQPYCIFTGDTLFVGDVGRPDLFSGNLSKEALAGMMYDSLNTKIKTLPDTVIVYPAHGPGSACGKSLGKETFTTIGAQKDLNYALRAASKEEFIRQVTDGLKEAPVYFALNAKMNGQNVPTLASVLSHSLKAMTADEVDAARKNEIWLLDVRNPEDFTAEFVPDSINIGLNGRFAEWAAKLIPFDRHIILVADEGKAEEAVTRLARVGFHKVLGYLDGGVPAWKSAGKPVDMIIDVTAGELAIDLPFDKKMAVIDVRNDAEFAAGHVQGAQQVALETLLDPVVMAQLDDEKNMYVHCAGGYRSVMACSLMKRQGYNNLRNVLGGWARMKQEAGLPLVLPASGQEA